MLDIDNIPHLPLEVNGSQKMASIFFVDFQ